MSEQYRLGACPIVLSRHGIKILTISGYSKSIHSFPTIPKRKAIQENVSFPLPAVELSDNRQLARTHKP